MCLCVCTETIFCFPNLAYRGKGALLQNLESDTWNPNASFKHNHCSSLVVDRGKGWDSNLETRQINWKGEGKEIKFYSPGSADSANKKVFEIQVLTK